MDLCCLSTCVCLIQLHSITLLLLLFCFLFCFLFKSFNLFFYFKSQKIMETTSEFCYLNKKYLFTTQMYIYTLQSKSIRNMTRLQRNLKDVRNTCLKQWIMDALITHTHTHTHSALHTHWHTHTQWLLHSLLSVDQHYIIWLNQKKKWMDSWYKWCFPITSSSPCHQAASNTEGARKSIGHASARPCDIKHINRTLE